MLFVISTILSLASCMIEKLLKPVFQQLFQASCYEQNLLNLKLEYKNQQSKLNMVDNFAKYSKIQRKINRIDQELHELQSTRIRNQFIFKNVSLYGIRIILGIVLMVFSIYYRHFPLLVLSDNMNLYPFESIISFPLQQHNCISVPFWIICCSTVGTVLKKIFNI